MAHSIRLAAGAIGILAAMAGPAYAQTYYGNLPLIYDDQPSDLLIPFSPEYGGREQGYSNTGFGLSRCIRSFSAMAPTSDMSPAPAPTMSQWELPRLPMTRPEPTVPLWASIRWFTTGKRFGCSGG